jgi:hypothetical protein
VESDNEKVYFVVPDPAQGTTTVATTNSNAAIVSGISWKATADGFVRVIAYRSAFHSDTSTTVLYISSSATPTGTVGNIWSTRIGGSSSMVFIKKDQYAILKADSGSDWYTASIVFKPYTVVSVPK